MVLQSFKMILTEALCVFLHLRKKPIRRQFWNSLQVDTDDDISVDISFWAKPRQTPQPCPSFRPFGLRKPQKVAKEVSTYFSLNLTRLRLWCYLRFIQDILLRLRCYLYFCLTGKVCGHLFTYFLRFSKAKWTERHVLRCPAMFSPKRVFHLISIIKSSEANF